MGWGKPKGKRGRWPRGKLGRPKQKTGMNPREKGKGQKRKGAQIRKGKKFNLNLNFRIQGYLKHKPELEEERRFLKIVC